jgi:AcrR family transcriptional regulator
VSESSQERVRRLPPGPHGLSPELVERNQRERLIAAMAEVCGERGYAGSSVAEVAKRAGVSTASFYRQFEGRRECMLVAFDELFERLLEALEGACEGGETAGDRARAGAGAAAALLAADPPTARLLVVEILAVGPEGIGAQHRAIERLAERLRGAAAGRPEPDAAWACAAAMVAVVGRRLASSEPPDAAELQALAALL